MTTSQIEKLLSGPLLAWREDDPTLLPHCVVCLGDIRIGAKYWIPRGTNNVVCHPCTEASFGSAGAA